ncbi:MAG TPA: WD40 repeat domain-containing serine/threonine-protein kinase [Blastocatellia bacterium]|nr:WD40 repeat domain-containing serine/threonine-protein kinase [Blastocatellia bacterium]
MTEPGYCTQCNSELPDDAPSGLCPKCLLELAFSADSESLASVTLPNTPLLSGLKVHYFGDYELLEEIARGGMGLVYKARQMSLNRIVALKMMRPGLLASEPEVQRFRVEAEAAASLQHPRIVAIHEVGEYEGLCYFSMDYVEGKSLAEIVRDQPLPARRAASYVKTIAETVDFAHQKGVLHRDLKPANVIIDSSDQPRITDFGLARRIDGDSRLTETGAVLGTPSYMPPEQAAGRRESLGPVSDVYSLGAMLYELLTGRPPFQAETPLDTIMMVTRAEPVAPRILNDKLDRDIETICLKCLEKEPRKRYRSARELADDLGRFLDHKPIKARRVAAFNRTWRWCRRNPWPASATAAVAVLAILAALTAVSFRERLWQSMIQQARSERLAGNRERSMERLAEAARMKRSDELRQEAIQTITSPGVRLRHTHPALHPHDGSPQVERLVVSPDSKLFAVSYRGLGEIKVWDLVSGQMLTKIDPYNNPLFDKNSPRHSNFKFEQFEFSPTEPIIAIHGHTNWTTRQEPYFQSLVLWNAMTGEPIAEIECDEDMPPREISAFIFSRDGKRIVWAANLDPGWLIDVPARSSRRMSVKGKPLAFSSNDEMLVDAPRGQLYRYNIATGESLSVMPEGSWLALGKVSRDSRFALVRFKDSLLMWDIQARTSTLIAEGFSKYEEKGVAWSDDGRVVATMKRAESNLIHLYDVTEAGVKHKTIPLDSSVRGRWDDFGVLSPDGSLLAVLGAEDAFNLWVFDTQTTAQVASLLYNHSPIWSADARLLITRGPGSANPDPEQRFSSKSFREFNSDVNVWEVFSPTPSYVVPDRLESLAFTPDGTQVVSDAVTWNIVSTRERIELRQAAYQPPLSTILSEGDQLWVSTTPSSRIFSLGALGRGIPLQEGFPLKLSQLAPDRGEVQLERPDYSLLKDLGKIDFVRPVRFAISPNGKFLVVASMLAARDDKDNDQWRTVLELWDLRDRKRIAVWDEDIRAPDGRSAQYSIIKFSPDGNRVAAAQGHDEHDYRIVIRDAATGTEIRQIRTLGLSSALTFSADGKLLFFSGAAFKEGGSPIFVHDVETGRPLGEWRGHYGGVMALTRSPDGRMLASGGADRMIYFWEIPSGRKLAGWEAHKSGISALDFSFDGKTLASGAEDATVKLWDLPFIRNELSRLGLPMERQ